MVDYLDVPKVSQSDYRRPDFEGWFTSEIRQRAAQNKITYNAAMEADYKIMHLIMQVYGENSAVYKYMKRQRVDTPPDLERRAKKVWQKYDAWLYAEQRRIYATDYRKRSREANERLQAMGYVPYDDYSPSSAITFERELLRQPETPANDLQLT